MAGTTFNPGLLGGAAGFQASQLGGGTFGGALPQVETGEKGFQQRLAPDLFQSPLDQAAKDKLLGEKGARGNKQEARMLQGTAALRAQLRESLKGVTEGFGQARDELAAADLAAQIGATEFLEGSREVGALDPFIEAGKEATERLQALSGLSGEEAKEEALAALQSSPEFQFRLEQGTKALQQSAAAKGLLGSGRFAQELQQYAQNLSQQFIGETIASQQALADIGSAAAGQLASIGMGVEQQQQELSAALERQRAELASQEAIKLAELRGGFEGQIAQLQQEMTLQREQFDVEKLKIQSQEQLGTRTADLNLANNLTSQAIALRQQASDIKGKLNWGGGSYLTQRERDRIASLNGQARRLDEQASNIFGRYKLLGAADQRQYDWEQDWRSRQ